MRIIIKIIVAVVVFFIGNVFAFADIGYQDIYIINYYKDSVMEKNLIDSVIKDKSDINIDVNYKVPDGYMYDEEKIIYDKEINIVYKKKNNLTYCVNYFYGGIIFVNNTECFYNRTYGEEITTFKDKPIDGYVFESFTPITVLDVEENIMNVFYEKNLIEEVSSVKEGVRPNFIQNLFNSIINFFIKIIA